VSARVGACALANPATAKPMEWEQNVTSTKHQQLQPRLYKLRRPTPAEFVADHHLGIARRRLGGQQAGASGSDQPGQPSPEALRRARFAARLARAEFGPSYWDARRTTAKQRGGGG
jgi:hypothetical protein